MSMEVLMSWKGANHHFILSNFDEGMRTLPKGRRSQTCVQLAQQRATKSNCIKSIDVYKLFID